MVRAASALVAKFAAEFGSQYFGRAISVLVAKVATDHCGLESPETPSFGRESLDMPKFVHKSLGMPKICPKILGKVSRTSTREQVLQKVQPVFSATEKQFFFNWNFSNFHCNFTIIFMSKLSRFNMNSKPPLYFFSKEQNIEPLFFRHWKNALKNLTQKRSNQDLKDVKKFWERCLGPRPGNK